MKILVIKGSPRKQGNSSFLADRFVSGASDAGHDVSIFDCAEHTILGCKACDECQTKFPCVQNDDFNALRDQVLGADLIVFTTPVYYYGVSGQLKCVIDRFYSVNSLLQGKKTMLFATMANPNVEVVESINMMYQNMVEYLNMKDCGVLYVPGVAASTDVRNKTQAGEQAYQIGRNLSDRDF